MSYQSPKLVIGLGGIGSRHLVEQLIKQAEEEKNKPKWVVVLGKDDQSIYLEMEPEKTEKGE